MIRHQYCIYKLGFCKKLLPLNVLYSSVLSFNIIKAPTFNFDCTIAVGAFYQDRLSSTIYKFAVRVDPWFAIDEKPQINSYKIHNISLKVLDKDFQPVYFWSEEIILIMLNWLIRIWLQTGKIFKRYWLCVDNLGAYRKTGWYCMWPTQLWSNHIFMFTPYAGNIYMY